MRTDRFPLTHFAAALGLLLAGHALGASPLTCHKHNGVASATRLHFGGPKPCAN